MAALATFGIFVAMIVVLLVIAGIFLRSPFILILIIMPVLITETLTGKSSGMFHPNGSGTRSPVFNAWIIFFVVVEVLLVAGILFGVYCLILGWPVSATTGVTTPTVFSALQLYRLQVVNSFLWLLAGFFVVMSLINTIRFRDRIKQMSKSAIYSYYILPLVTYPAAFVFLATSRTYLLHYPDHSFDLSLFAKTCAVVYSCYLIGVQIHWLYSYVTTLRNHISQLKFHYWFSLATGLLYKVIFIYFVVQIFASL